MSRVLVVDDDKDIRSGVELALTDEHQVRVAEHGLAALDTLADFQPDVILLDMRMPVMDGWAFLKAYQATPAPHARVVVMSAAHDARQLAKDVGATGHLAKPFDLDELATAVGPAKSASGH